MVVPEGTENHIAVSHEVSESPRACVCEHLLFTEAGGAVRAPFGNSRSLRWEGLRGYSLVGFRLQLPAS